MGQHHEKLADEAAAQFRAKFIESLPRLAHASIEKWGDGSFSCTAQVGKTKGGDPVMKLSFRERIAIEPVEVDLDHKNGQLALFGGKRPEPGEDGE